MLFSGTIFDHDWSEFVIQNPSDSVLNKAIEIVWVSDSRSGDSRSGAETRVDSRSGDLHRVDSRSPELESGPQLSNCPKILPECTILHCPQLLQVL